MGGDQTCYSECRKLVENLANDISNGLDGMETEVLPKISLLKKSIGVLIDQSVSVSRYVHYYVLLHLDYPAKLLHRRNNT